MRLTEELSFVAKLIFFFLHRSKKNYAYTKSYAEHIIVKNMLYFEIDLKKTIQPYLYNEEEIPPSLIKTKPNNNNKKQTNKINIRTNEALKQGIKRNDILSGTAKKL